MARNAIIMCRGIRKVGISCKPFIASINICSRETTFKMFSKRKVNRCSIKLSHRIKRFLDALNRHPSKIGMQLVEMRRHCIHNPLRKHDLQSIQVAYLVDAAINIEVMIIMIKQEWIQPQEEPSGK